MEPPGRCDRISRYLVEQVPNQPPIPSPLDRVRPTARELEAYPGLYATSSTSGGHREDSGGLVARFRGDTLRLARRWGTFVGGGVVMKFRRAGGRVTGALLHSGACATSCSAAVPKQ